MFNAEQFLEKYITKIGQDSGIKDLPSAVAYAGQTLRDATNIVNPLGYLTAPLEKAGAKAIGKGLIGGQGIEVLTEPRQSDGTFDRTFTDYLFNTGSKEKEAAGLKAAKAHKPLKVIGQEGFEYTDPTTGRVRTADELTRAATMLQTDEAQTALLEQATFDPYTDSKTKIKNAGEVKGLENVTDGLGITPENLSSSPSVRKTQLNKAIENNTYDEGENRLANSYRETTRKKENLEKLIREEERFQTQAKYDLASLQATIGQAELDREYLDRRDMRDYEYKIQKDEAAQMDKIFALIMGMGNSMF